MIRKDFIKKFETPKFLLGSFDVYSDTTRKLIRDNYRSEFDPKVVRRTDANDHAGEVLGEIKNHNFRYAIVSKRKQEYVGYIALFDIDRQYDKASIRFETNEELSDEEKEEILSVYRDYMSQSISIKNIEHVVYGSNKTPIIDMPKKEEKETVEAPSIILERGLTIDPGVSEETKKKFEEQYKGSTEDKDFLCTIKANSMEIGIIGLSNLDWGNKRADLSLFLDKGIDKKIVQDLSGEIIDNYLDFVHKNSVHNVRLLVGASNELMLRLARGSKLNYYGESPFSSLNGNDIESALMFQGLPYLEKQKGVIRDSKQSIGVSDIPILKEKMDPIVTLDNGFRLVSPSAFEEEHINFDRVLQGYIKAMQDRKNFTIPLGQDEYGLQHGYGKYGLSKTLGKYEYVILDPKNNYSGHQKIIRKNANGLNYEIETAVAPRLQGQGLGTEANLKFDEQLFATGIASVTAHVYSENARSQNMFGKIAEECGTRINCYYINGELHDMTVFVKTNPAIEESRLLKISR